METVIEVNNTCVLQFYSKANATWISYATSILYIVHIH